MEVNDGPVPSHACKGELTIYEEDELPLQNQIEIDCNKHWVDHDLSALMDSDLQEQLETILGKEDAQDFLKPKIKENENSRYSNEVGKKIKSSDANKLWEYLRKNSFQKMSKLDCTPGYYQQCNEDNDVRGTWKMDQIQLQQQRLDLMHRVAQVNQVRTKQILKHVKLPRLTRTSSFGVEQINRGDDHKDFENVSTDK